MFEALDHFQIDNTKDAGFSIDTCDVPEMVSHSYTLPLINRMFDIKKNVTLIYLKELTI